MKIFLLLTSLFLNHAAFAAVNTDEFEMIGVQKEIEMEVDSIDEEFEIDEDAAFWNYTDDGISLPSSDDIEQLAKIPMSDNTPIKELE